ncbi:LysR family transcriptional regulator [Sphingobium aromaticiconvertens]|uniref:LysR family transcriptional regulator n=1 Tax=Sphingobium aromaticiconvertens TaxID=365341 RepID=UPI0030176C92
MDIRKLRHITTLAREAHFGRAADRLGVTQSALTRSIQATESELGLRLFDRGREGVHLTRAGAAMLDDASLVLRQMDLLERNMALLAQRTIGQVHCGLGPLAATLLLPDVLSRIARDHGQLRIRTRLGGVTELQQLLHDGDLDFAVLAHPLVTRRANDLSLRRIGQLSLGALVRRNHPLANRFASREEMTGFPIIGGGAVAADGMADVDYAPTITCDNFEIARAVTLASDAIWITAETLADEELTPVYGLPIAQDLQIVVASLARRTLSPPALLVIDMMTTALQHRRAACLPRQARASESSEPSI